MDKGKPKVPIKLNAMSQKSNSVLETARRLEGRVHFNRTPINVNKIYQNAADQDKITTDPVLPLRRHYKDPDGDKRKL